MAKKDLSLSCPYCANEIAVPAPEEFASKGPTDLRCMPYTRDIGRFDPEEESDWLKQENWSRIGKDYLSWMNWESIGILRTVKEGMNIQYRVQGCPRCKNLFDVYANYSKDKISTLWGHLFGQGSTDSSPIDYRGDSILTYAVKGFQRYFKDVYASAFMVTMVFLLISLLPWIFLPQALKDLEGSSNLFRFTLLTKGTMTLGISLIIYFIIRYKEFIEKSTGFEDLFDIRDKQGFHYWKNFTLCRLIGVQQTDKKPVINQVDFIVGCLSLFLLLITWSSTKLSGVALFLFYLMVLLIVAAWLIRLYVSFKFKSRKWFSFLYRSLKFVVPIVLFIVFLSVSLAKMDAVQAWDFLNSILELPFWFFCIFIIGTATWYALSATVYIIKGISKIPLRISPYNHFANFSPIRKLQSYSTTIMGITFITMVVFLAFLIFQNDSPTENPIVLFYSDHNWIITFFLLAVGAIITALGIGSKQPAFFYLALFYLSLIYFTNGLNATLFGLEINIPDLLISIFFSSILIYQFFSTEIIARGILQAKKEESLNELTDQLMQYQQTPIEEVEQRPEKKYEILQRILSLSKDLQEVSEKSAILTKVIKMSGPILTSILMNQIIKPLISSIGLFNF